MPQNAARPNARIGVVIATMVPPLLLTVDTDHGMQFRSSTSIPAITGELLATSLDAIAMVAAGEAARKQFSQRGHRLPCMSAFLICVETLISHVF